MAMLVIDLPDDALALVEKHARELGYDTAADYGFELVRNPVATREDAHYARMHAGEHNHVFGRSKREKMDLAAREAADLAARAAKGGAAVTDTAA